MKISAKYGSRCPKCEAPIRVGDSVDFNPTAPKGKRVCHVACVESPDLGGKPAEWPPVPAWSPAMISEYMECLDIDDECLEREFIKLGRPYPFGVTLAIISGTPAIIAKDVIDKAAAATKIEREAARKYLDSCGIKINGGR